MGVSRCTIRWPPIGSFMFQVWNAIKFPFQLEDPTLEHMKCTGGGINLMLHHAIPWSTLDQRAQHSRRYPDTGVIFLFFLSSEMHENNHVLEVEGRFIHDIESPWQLHFKHSHWWKMRRSRSKFVSHYAQGTNGVYKWMQDVCKVYMDSYKNHLLEVG